MKIKRIYDWTDFVELFHRYVTCRVFGHKMKIRKRYGFLCTRCRIFEEY